MGCCASCDDGGPCDCGTPGCTGGCKGHDVSGSLYDDWSSHRTTLGPRGRNALEIGAAAGQGSYRDDTRELANYMSKGGQICTSGFDWGSFLSSIPLHIGNWCAIPDINGTGNYTLNVLPTGMIVPDANALALMQAMGIDLSSYLNGVPNLTDGGAVISSCLNELLPMQTATNDTNAYNANLAYCVNCYGWAMGTKDALPLHYGYGGGNWEVAAAPRIVPIYFHPAGPNYADDNGTPILFASNIMDLAQKFDMGTTMDRAQSGQGGTTVSLAGFVQKCSDGSLFGYAGPPSAAGQDIPGYGSVPNPYYDPSQPVSPTNQPYLPAGTGITFPTGSPGYGNPGPLPPGMGGTGPIGPSGVACISDGYGGYIDPVTGQPCGGGAIGPYGGYPPPAPFYPPQMPYPSVPMYPPQMPQMPYGYPDPSQFWQPLDPSSQTPDPSTLAPQFYADPSQGYGYPQMFPLQQGGGGLLGNLFGGGGGGGILPDIGGILNGILSMVPDIGSLLGSVGLPDIGTLLESLPLPDVSNILGGLGIDLGGILGGLGGGLVSGEVGAALNPLAGRKGGLSISHLADGTIAHTLPTGTPAKGVKAAPNAKLQKAKGSPVLWKRLNKSQRKAQLQRYRQGHNSHSPAPDYSASVKKAATTALNAGALKSPASKTNVALHLAASGNIKAANQALSGINKTVAANVLHTGMSSTALGRAGAQIYARNLKTTPIELARFNLMNARKSFGVSGDYDNAGAASAFSPLAYGYQTPTPSDFYATYFYQGDKAHKFGPPVEDPNYPTDDPPPDLNGVSVDPTLLGIPSEFAFGPQPDEMAQAGGMPYGFPFDDGGGFDPNSPTGNPYDPNAYGQSPGDDAGAGSPLGGGSGGGGGPVDPGASGSPAPGPATGPATGPAPSNIWNTPLHLSTAPGSPWAGLNQAFNPPAGVQPMQGHIALPTVPTHLAIAPAPTRAPVALRPPPRPRPFGKAASVMGFDFGDALSSVTKVITQRGAEGNSGGPTTDAINKAAAQKPGGSDQLVHDIVDNVIKFAPLLIAVLGDLDYGGASADSLYILAKNGDKSAVHELFVRSKIGDPEASAMVRGLFGLPVDLGSLVSGDMGAWTMMDEIEIADKGYEIHPYGLSGGPWGMGGEISPYGYAGPTFVGGDDGFIDSVVAQALQTVQGLMDMARNGDRAAQEAVVSIYRAAQAGDPDAQSVVMLTAQTPQMPYHGTSEKRARGGGTWGPFRTGCGR